MGCSVSYPKDVRTEWLPRDDEGRIRVDLSGTAEYDADVSADFQAGQGIMRGQDGSILATVTALPDSVVSRDEFDASLRGQPVPVAGDASPPFDGATALPAADLGGTAWLQHLMLRTATGIRLAYSNFYNDSSGSETDGPNEITVTAGLEYPNTQVFWVTFGGQRSVTIQPGATVLSDPVGVTFPKGVLVRSRTYVVPADGGKFPRGGFITNQTTAEGNNYASPAGDDLTAPGSSVASGSGTNQRVFGPSMILGVPIDPGKAVAGLVGDSIMSGNGDSSRGLFQRGLADNYSFQKIAFPGEGFHGVVNTHGAGFYRRMSMLATVNVSHLICNYGVNSLNSATIQQDAVSAWARLAYLGRPIYVTTLTPQTSSTDSWATVGNQTILDATKETCRLAYNAWVRDGAPVLAGAPAAVGSAAAGTSRIGEAGHPTTGAAGFLEVADLAESARDSGKWRSAYTSDGTHPNATGSPAMGAALAPTLATLLGATSA